MPAEALSTGAPTGSKMSYIKEVVRDHPMNLSVTGYQIAALTQALQDADMLWDARIAEAEMGAPNRRNFSIEGARLLQDDLRDLLQQIQRAERG